MFPLLFAVCVLLLGIVGAYPARGRSQKGKACKPKSLHISSLSPTSTYYPDSDLSPPFSSVIVSSPTQISNLPISASTSSSNPCSSANARTTNSRQGPYASISTALSRESQAPASAVKPTLSASTYLSGSHITISECPSSGPVLPPYSKIVSFSPH